MLSPWARAEGLSWDQPIHSVSARRTRAIRALVLMGCEDREVAVRLVPLFRARVQVSLRPSVLDPAGEATRAAAARLGVSGIQRLRIGKAIEVELEAPDRGSAQHQLELLSDRLLANPVIEDWTLDVAEAPEPA
jgi:phosphoribosylformylglycinamidine synthase PurS subunit